MTMQSYTTPDLRPPANPVAFTCFGADEDLPISDITCNATAAKKRSRYELEVSHHYTPPPLFNMPQHHQSRLYRSHSTSTISRTSTTPAREDIEIDALIRLQTERMRSELEFVWKRQCRDLISVVLQQVVKMIDEKDAELEKARWRISELELKVREIAAEIQIWFNVAKDNEAVVCNLRSAIDRAIIQNAALTSPTSEPADCDSAQHLADDAESCCYA